MNTRNKADLSADSVVAQDLKPYLSQIQALVSEFNEVWCERVLHAEVYPIPFYDVAMEMRAGKEVRVPIVPDVIQPEFYTGETAIREAKAVFSQFAWKPEQHQVTTRRVPGVIVVSSLSGLYEPELISNDGGYSDTAPEPYEGEMLINRINSLKRELHWRIKQAFPPGSRAVVTQRLFKGISMLQLYRIIHAVEYPVPARQLGFTWAGQTSAISALSYDEAIELVEASRKNRPVGTEQHFWDEQIQSELDAVKGFYGHEFRIRRPLATHPRVQTYIDGSTKPQEMFQANLPILLLSKDGRIPLIKPLKHWDRRSVAARAKRKKQMPLSLAVDRLNLFAVL